MGKPVAEQAASAGGMVRREGDLSRVVASLTGVLGRFLALLDSGVPQGGVEFIAGQFWGGGGWGFDKNN